MYPSWNQCMEPDLGETDSPEYGDDLGSDPGSADCLFTRWITAADP